MEHEKRTYTGQSSYHEMMIRAQSLSPALTFAMCSLLQEIKIVDDKPYQFSKVISLHGDERKGFEVYFDRPATSCVMSLFLKAVFGGFNVYINTKDAYGYDLRLCADTQFVRWLQSGVVSLAAEDKLAIVHIKKAMHA